MTKKIPTIKIKLEGISGFTIRDVVVHAAADGTAEMPEWVASTPEFCGMIAELAIKGIKIQNLGELPDVPDAPAPVEAPAPTEEPATPAEEAK